MYAFGRCECGLHTYLELFSVWMHVAVRVIIALVGALHCAHGGPGKIVQSIRNVIRSSSSAEYSSTALAKTPISWAKLPPHVYPKEPSDRKDDVKIGQYVSDLNAITNTFLQNMPMYQHIEQRYTGLLQRERCWDMQKHDQYYYFQCKDSAQKKSTYYRKRVINDKPQIFLNGPNDLPKFLTILTKEWSHDGKVLAYSVKYDGNDMEYIEFSNSDGTNANETIRDVRNSKISWMWNNSGIFYSAYRQVTLEHSVKEIHALFFHEMGSKNQDVAVAYYSESDNLIIHGEVYGNYLFVSVFSNGYPQIYFFNLANIQYKITGKLNLTRLLTTPAKYTFIGTFDVFWNSRFRTAALFLTDRNAPMHQVIGVWLGDKDSNSNWFVIVREDKKRKLEFAAIAKDDRLVVVSNVDVKHEIHVYDLRKYSIRSARNPPSYQIPAPGGAFGAVSDLFVRNSSSEIIFTFSTFLVPPTIYCGTLQSAGSDVVLTPIYQQRSVVDPKIFKVEQISYHTIDGDKQGNSVYIPMYIISTTDCKRNSENPVIVTAYGGFGESLMPEYYPAKLLEAQDFGFLLAFPSLRGGGEKGDDWHRAAMREKKQTTFNDCIAAIEYLIENNYTDRERVALDGTGIGGLAMAVVAEQRPDIVIAVIIRCGILNMQRLRKTFIPELGDPAQKHDLDFLEKYSPPHNVKYAKNQEAPATLLLCTADDDNADHTFKHIAALQHWAKTTAAKWQENPLLALVTTDVNANVEIEQEVDALSFLHRVMGLQWKSSQNRSNRPRNPSYPRQY